MPHALLLTLALTAGAAAAPAAPVAPAPVIEKKADAAPVAPPVAPASGGLTGATIAAPSAPGSENLWLVAPLYPGQELLVSRTENAIHKLLPAASADQVGHDALITLLGKKKGDLGCALGERACREPLDDYMRTLGLVKLVLIKGGQEEPNYRYEVTSIDLNSGEIRAASGQGPILEKALLAALVKVAPLASSLTVTSTPSDSELYVDGEKIGRTPYEGQILPGERTLKLVHAGNKETVKTIQVPARGVVKLDEKLELMPSTLVVKATPKEANIFVDGEQVGQGEASVPISPGKHMLKLTLKGYEDFEKEVFVETNRATQEFPDMQATSSVGIMSKSLYLKVGFHQETMLPVKGIYRVNATAFDKVTGLENPPIGALGLSDKFTTLNGISIDFGNQKSFFGLDLVGLTYFFPASGSFKAYSAGTSFNDRSVNSIDANFAQAAELRAVQPQFNFALWKFMLQLQGGLGLRMLYLDTPTFQDVKGVTHENGYIDFAPFASAQAGLRFYPFEGLFIQGNYRVLWAVSLTAPQGAFSTMMPSRGFDLGLGYAF